MLKTEKIKYNVNGKEFVGYAAYDSSSNSKKPAIIIAHAWRGQDDFARKKAEELAKKGYFGFAADLYGNGIEVKTDEEASKLMKPLFVDRAELRARITGALNAIKNHPQVDSTKIGAIGFCFGGLTVLELAKSGEPVVGVVSFHGLLGNNLGATIAKTVPNAKEIKSKILVLHGHDDPSVSKEHIANFQKEMTDAKVDWQMHIYSNTMHAFTNPEANNPSHGLLYQPVSAKRAWQSMDNFFNEIFKQGN